MAPQVLSAQEPLYAVVERANLHCFYLLPSVRIDLIRPKAAAVVVSVDDLGETGLAAAGIILYAQLDFAQLEQGVNSDIRRLLECQPSALRSGCDRLPK